MEIYEKNINALGSIDPDLAKEVEGHESGDVRVIPSRSGAYTMLYKERPIHSRFDPLKETEKIYKKAVERYRAGKFNFLFVIGLGLGYHIKGILKEIKVRIILYEPSLDILKAALYHRDISEELKDGRLTITTEVKAIKEFFLRNYKFGHLSDYLALPPYQNLFYSSFINALSTYKDSIFSETINTVTVAQRAKEWTLSICKNIKHVLSSKNIGALIGKFFDIPAIIISSGPSLDESMDSLKGFKDRALLIGLDCSLKPLLSRDIIPDIVINMEPSPQVKRFFDGLNDLSGIRAVLMDRSGSHLYKIKFKERYVLFSNFWELSVWLSSLLGEGNVLAESPSVACQAFQCAVLLGCNPIILAGQDLSFREDRMYASGTIYQNNRWNPNRPGTLMVPSSDGRMLNTIQQFYVQIIWFEGRAEAINTEGRLKLINSTPGGAQIKGFEDMGLEAVRERYCRREIDIDNMFPRSQGWFQTENFSMEIKDILKMDQRVLDRIPEYSEKLDEIFYGIEEDIKRLPQERLECLEEDIKAILDSLIDLISSSILLKSYLFGKTTLLEGFKRTRTLREQSFKGGMITRISFIKDLKNQLNEARRELSPFIEEWSDKD